MLVSLRTIYLLPSGESPSLSDFSAEICHLLQFVADIGKAGPADAKVMCR